MTPQMTSNEIAMFRYYLGRASVYFEFGCGGSTILADSYFNIKKIYSVESDELWISKVKETSKHKKAVFSYVDINAGNWGSPKDDSKKDNWHLYSSALDLVEDVPDVILVDGRFRVACAVKAYHKLKDGVMLVHDYAREQYHVVEELFELIERKDNLAAFRKKAGLKEKALEMYENYKFKVD
jgi:protein O-GlcNAc transferase